MMNKSKGHVLFLGKYEFFNRSGDLYQAVSANPIMPDGSRSGPCACPTGMAYDHLKMIIDTFDLHINISSLENPDALMRMSQFRVETLEDAAKAVQDYISEYDLDANQFISGDVWVYPKNPKAENIQKVAHILYSGRIWIGELEEASND